MREDILSKAPPHAHHAHTHTPHRIALFENIEIDYRATPSNHNEMTVCLIV